MISEHESVVRERISERLTRERLALETRRARRPFIVWVGLLAGFVLALILLLHELHLPGPWTSTYSFRVLAPDLTAVQPGNEVRIAGVQVGHVTSVGLAGDAPELTAEIGSQYAPLYRNAELVVRPNTPLQDMYVEIVSRGSAPAGRLPAGAELTAAHVQSPVQFGQFLDIFDAAVRPRVVASIDALGQGLGDHGSQLRQALVELSPFLKAAQRFAYQTAIRRQETERLVHNFGLLNAELAKRSAEVTNVVRDGATTMRSLAAVEQPLGALINDLPPVLSRIPPTFQAVDGASGQLIPAAHALLTVADALPAGLGAIDRLSPVASSSMAALDRALPGLRTLLSATSPLSRDLTGAFAHLRPTAPQLDHITSAIIPCELAVQKFFQWTLSTSKIYGLHGDMQRGLGLLGPQTAGALADGKLNANQGILSVAPTCSRTPPGP